MQCGAAERSQIWKWRKALRNGRFNPAAFAKFRGALNTKNLLQAQQPVFSMTMQPTQCYQLVVSCFLIKERRYGGGGLHQTHANEIYFSALVKPLLSITTKHCLCVEAPRFSGYEHM